MSKDGWRPIGESEFTYSQPIRRWRPTYTQDKGRVMPWVKIVLVTRTRIWTNQFMDPSMHIRSKQHWITEEEYLRRTNGN